MYKNTIINRKSDLDKFYTNPKIAELCIDILQKKINIDKDEWYLEPSAGSGSFSDLLPENRRVCLDLKPENKYIIKKDFFDFTSEKMFITVGNPPFGKNAGLAVKFFNHAAKFSKVIAFIIPLTFRKISIQDKLDLNFRLIHDVELPKNSFLLNGKEYDVPCCFQIWEKTQDKREKTVVDFEKLPFKFVSKEDAHFAVRRVGGGAGKVVKEFTTCNTNSNLFIRVKNKKNIFKIIKNITNLNLKELASNTVGVRSVSKKEIALAYFKEYVCLADKNMEKNLKE